VYYPRKVDAGTLFPYLKKNHNQVVAVLLEKTKNTTSSANRSRNMEMVVGGNWLGNCMIISYSGISIGVSHSTRRSFTFDWRPKYRRSWFMVSLNRLNLLEPATALLLLCWQQWGASASMVWRGERGQRWVSQSDDVWMWRGRRAGWEHERHGMVRADMAMGLPWLAGGKAWQGQATSRPRCR